MKKVLYIYGILMWASLISSCKKETPVAVSVGVGNGGVWVSVSIGGVSGGYSYPNGFPSTWSDPRYNEEIAFVGYIEASPLANNGIPITNGKGVLLTGPDGKSIFANAQQYFLEVSSWDYTRGPVAVYIIGQKDLSGKWYYIIR
jgi:hypothetical protein